MKHDRHGPVTNRHAKCSFTRFDSLRYWQYRLFNEISIIFSFAQFEVKYHFTVDTIIKTLPISPKDSPAGRMSVNLPIAFASDADFQGFEDIASRQTFSVHVTLNCLQRGATSMYCVIKYSYFVSLHHVLLYLSPILHLPLCLCVFPPPAIFFLSASSSNFFLPVSLCRSRTFLCPAPLSRPVNVFFFLFIFLHNFSLRLIVYNISSVFDTAYI